MDWEWYRITVLILDTIAWFSGTVGKSGEILKVPQTPMDISDTFTLFVVMLLLCIANLIAVFSCAEEKEK